MTIRNLIKYNDYGYPINLIATARDIEKLRSERVAQVARERITKEKLQGMKPEEINNRWIEIQSYLSGGKNEN